ncbi:glycosyltransferase family 1 protein [Fodinicola feengrottensis]|uniref:glycogen phosphorylase n=1 Tax=Fodinicola feengrottensis TaxID=435914 RepID=A0ABN2FTH8_9ACTN
MAALGIFAQVKALRRFTVRAALPAPLAPLSELVMNLRWAWHTETTDLFAAVDPQLWQTVAGDPVRLLGEVSAERLDALARDGAFIAQLNAVHADLQGYLSEPRWYQSMAGVPGSIAYFSPEFGITEVLPQYSGGLGILAGDHLKAASDLGVPILGVGLLYHAGYFTQSLSPDGWQEEHYPSLDPNGLPLALLRNPDGTPLEISVGLPDGQTLGAQIWQAQVGRVPLLLMDADIESNDPSIRAITDRLYGGGAEHRLRQELLLGIGGVRAVRAYCHLTGAVEPEVYHTNEGHAGFQGLERIRELVAGAGLSFDDALQAVRAGTVFTTHTPVPAGIDRFPRTLIEHTFGGDNASPGVPVDRILALGAEDDPGVFNMAHMGLRLGQRANGVSKLHGHVSREMFSALWPGFGSVDVPISSVTNGVHAPSWVAREITELLGVGPQSTWEIVGELPADRLWAIRRELRGRLVDEVRRRVHHSMVHRGHTEAELGWVQNVFDPDVLTIGFARRVPSYKRLTMMLRDPARLRAMLTDPERPIQIVIAGKSHPADEGGKHLIQQMVQFADDPAVRNRIVFLPDYDIGMAQFLYAGCDVWLNNPLRPLEACGTSGMKSALNGGLNLSIRDGWWDEMYDGGNGWAIPTADGIADPDRRDDLEAAAFYDLVEQHVRARFYDRGADGVPKSWIDMVRHTLKSLGPLVQATRMVRDYVEELYTPAGAAAGRLAASSYEGARELAGWYGRIRAGWDSVRVAHVDASGTGDTPQLGASMHLRAEVVLGPLSPSDVTVQACYGRVDATEELHDVTCVEMSHTGDGDEFTIFDGDVPLQRAGAFGYTVRVLPRHELLSSSAEPGLVVLAS